MNRSAGSVRSRDVTAEALQINCCAASVSLRRALIACAAGASLRRVLTGCAIVTLLVMPAGAAVPTSDDAARHDEFGLIPDDGADKDLYLPDPVLDRTWPGPKPGEDGKNPEKIAPDEDKDDPFLDEDAPAPPPPSKAAPEPDRDEGLRSPTRSAPPPVGPDGKREPGSPAPELDPDLPDVLEPDVSEPSEIEKDESRPSPLDKDDEQYDEESSDPAEW